MRVDNNLPNPWLQSPASSKAANKQTTDGTTVAGGPVDNSRTNADLLPPDSLHIKSPAVDAPRTDKIEAIQRAIAGGTYEVSAENIADAILRDWQAQKSMALLDGSALSLDASVPERRDRDPEGKRRGL